MPDMSLETPLEIPRLVITPSTPTEDLPLPPSSRGRRPTLFRSSSLLDQFDNIPIPTINTAPTGSTTLRSSSASRSRVGNDKKSTGYLLPPYHDHPPIRQRPGRGTATSLILIALALLLVLSSAMLSPESITALLHSETEWMASDPIQFNEGNTITNTNADGPQSESYIMEAQLESSHYDEDDLIETTSIPNEDGSSRDPRTETDSEREYHTIGPVMTNDAWRSYLKRKAEVTGQAGPTAHFEACDFH